MRLDTQGGGGDGGQPFSLPVCTLFDACEKEEYNWNSSTSWEQPTFHIFFSGFIKLSVDFSFVYLGLVVSVSTVPQLIVGK